MVKFVLGVIVVAVVAAAGWLLYERYADVSNREVKTTVSAESAAIQAQVDDRYQRLDQKLDRIEAKIDRIESKLDRLIELATPHLPDNMTPAK